MATLIVVMRPDSMRMYQAAEALVAEVELLLPRARARKPNAAEHLERSADSAMFNMCEGIGSFRPKMKISAYEIARKESNEVRAVLRKLVIARVFTEREVERAYNLAGSIVGMLTGRDHRKSKTARSSSAHAPAPARSFRSRSRPRTRPPAVVSPA